MRTLLHLILGCRLGMELLLGLKSPAYDVYVEWLEKVTLKTLSVRFLKRKQIPQMWVQYFILKISKYLLIQLFDPC